MDRSRPVVAIICSGRASFGRPAQMVSERFIEPVVAAGGSTVLIPAMPDAVDIAAVAGFCDALLMSGAISNVHPESYGVSCDEEEPATHDRGRDAVSFRLAEAMINAGKPVLGICRGMQELNVLFGGTLTDLPTDGLHVYSHDWTDSSVYCHRHVVAMSEGSVYNEYVDDSRALVVSAHSQGIERLGEGLTVDAVAGDGLVEAFSTCVKSQVSGVQWHPELSDHPLNDEIFRRLVRAA